jgi:hypothetical protein
MPELSYVKQHRKNISPNALFQKNHIFEVMEKSTNFVVIDFIGMVCCIRFNFMVEEQREDDVQGNKT